MKKMSGDSVGMAQVKESLRRKFWNEPEDDDDEPKVRFFVRLVTSLVIVEDIEL